ncbi:MAG TPA: hypothetical protein VLV81_02130 [Acidimicrobiia bacterium]|nr:hypothetical protein [Acidimicrobiia bacterium]
MADGVYFDDPAEAVGYLRDKVLGKRLGGAGMEIRPTSLPQGPSHLGLARMRAANRMDLAVIPRVAIGAAKKGQVPLWVIPPGKNPADQVPATLAAAQVSAPAGEATPGGYRMAFPKDTPPDQIIAFAQQAITAMGVQPGQGWQWISRGGDQLPG